MKTNQFEKFHIWNYNRQIKPPHLKDIKNSIEEEGFREELKILVSSIQNEVRPGQHIVLDGQHRFEACRQLDCEFYYEIVDDSITRKQIEHLIRLYNVERLDLVFDDYAYMNRDNKNYSKLLELRDKTGFSIRTMLRSIYQWKPEGASPKERTRLFANGAFTINDYGYNKILRVYSVWIVFNKVKKPDFRGGARHWIKSISSILSNPKIDMDELMDKIEKHGYKIENRGDQHANTVTLYYIYNLHRKNKVDIPSNIIKR